MVHPPKKTGSDDPLNKTAIRKRLHFTDERHDLAAAIRKYGVFADGPALPFRDTGFWARNGVSLQGKTSVSQNLLAIQTFGRKRVCRGIENSSMGENLFAIQVFWPKMMCRCMGNPLFPQNLLAIQTFGRKMVCRGKKNSSMSENLFTTGQWGQIRVGGQLRFRGCDFLLSLRPFFEKLRSVV